MEKEKKVKKQLSEEQLQRLAEARVKANEMRKVNQAKRLQTKMDNLKYNGDGTPKEQIEEKQFKENEVIAEEPLKEPEPQTHETQEETPLEEEQVIIKKKAPKKKKQVVIVEQSDDDSDEFESNQNVLFVKRVSKNKKKELPPPEPEEPKPQPPPLQQAPRREPPIAPRRTQHDALYNEMFSGAFLNNQLMGHQRRF